ncbi:chemotaxis protein CheW [Desulfolutivibrio sulfoxidireducens]|uniref:chemotaxis protein CheW n=1 Tax=Desulfolutivibrio sulfoxidireducens TaxID=2773299 RepID=UPI00159D37FC|nr:chemotaxis protein CheW [Desulfolutivibrio sulfoxidireducens]QLA17808.1 chemotaxis protein CheW [Desulfolutivibrio sulfoxidireducens]QLA21386.1 chemotaxis protein CheW [Desulfolutivibrio sulfoxidireducens]
MADSLEKKQYLTFCLGEELFALESSLVLEVLEVPAITRIPRVPEFLVGVINLRGNAATVVDLRRKFGMASTRHTRDTCVIVVEREFEGECLAVGLLADSVREVLEIAPNDVVGPPEMGLSVDAAYVSGVARHGDGFLMLLDASRLLSIEELAARADRG